MARLLVIDDEANLRHTLGYALRQEGHDVLTAEDGERGIEVFRESQPDAVILDVMLPRLDGFEVCRRLRRESDVPILMLTARDTELDTVVGLEIGADDYLAKPFSMRELIARVRAMLRRTRRGAEEAGPERLEADGLVLDVPRHRVTRDGEDVALKPKEFDLLQLLMANPGRVLGRDQILARVWGYEYAGDTRTVDTHVKTLRERLGDRADRPRWIETVRGVGYRFREGGATSS
ncbi:MAG TPA: response regulator transcription factor [Candidatus Limnocylindrales bacterium]|nr:response regulator transcription factor [Candidatus Limnocylindrales bacterium]